VRFHLEESAMDYGTAGETDSLERPYVIFVPYRPPELAASLILGDQYGVRNSYPLSCAVRVGLHLKFFAVEYVSANENYR
jgi:hypothetical protein